MLQVIATLSPDHEIFNKDYCRPRNEVNVPYMVINPNGYFDGLHVEKRTGKRMISLLDSAPSKMRCSPDVEKVRKVSKTHRCFKNCSLR